MKLKQIAKGFLAILWALPWTAAGVFLCATVILAPIGLSLIAFGVYPLKRLLTKKVHQAAAKSYQRDREPWTIFLEESDPPVGY